MGMPSRNVRTWLDDEPRIDTVAKLPSPPYCVTRTPTSCERTAGRSSTRPRRSVMSTIATKPGRFVTSDARVGSRRRHDDRRHDRHRIGNRRGVVALSVARERTRATSNNMTAAATAY